MVATVEFKQYYGAGPTEASMPAGNMRFCTSDELEPAANAPIPIPGTGTNYSYCRAIAFYASVAPDTSITSIYIYTDGGGFGTGDVVYVGDQYATTYIQATGTPGTTGTEMTALYSGVVTSKADLFGYTSGSPKGTVTQIATSGTGRYTKYIILQEAVTNAASSGANAAETITGKYNEV